MLPSTGCFRSINCPYHGNSCTRPYCHFKHKKRTQELTDTTSTTVDETVPTYNPTPKSQLQSVRNHIPISYVPDLISGRSERTSLKLSSFGSNSATPTYNPTPLSILSSSSKFNNLASPPDSIEEKLTSNDDNKEVDEAYVPVSKAKKTKSTIKYVPSSLKGNALNGENLDRLKDVSSQEEEQDTEDNKKSKQVKQVKSKDVKSSQDSKKSEYKSKSKSSSKEKEKSKSSKSSSTSKEKSKHGTHKSKSKDRHVSKSKHSKDKSSSSSHKTKHKEDVLPRIKKEIKQEKCDDIKKPEPIAIKIKEEKTDSYDESTFNEPNLYTSDEESDLEEDSIMECYKIFNEYHSVQNPPLAPPPAEPVHETTPMEESEEEPIITGKKRIAHENADKHIPTKKTILNNIRPIMTPAQMMNNRFKMAIMAKANNEQLDISREIKDSQMVPPKRPVDVNKKVLRVTKITRVAAPVPTPAHAPTPTTSLIDDIINGKTSKPKKIAPVQNVNLIQQAKAKIAQMCRPNTDHTSKTPIQTASKHTGRTAHTPDVSTFDLPDLLESDRSKLPVNVRNRFLSMLAVECARLYVSKEEAHARAQSEELKCYERCQVLVTYKNSAMLAISRIRKELQERETSGLGPLMPGERSGKSSDNTSELKGKKLYENIRAYALNAEELELHGFPREGSESGKAVVKMKKSVSNAHLHANERRCCRCGKVYRVDRRGFALYPEECLYHPLKKRTFRGESYYLCCKSTEDSGCVTSNTHVCDSVPGLIGELEGYQKTMPSEGENDPRDYAVYALDCEMCYTTRGLELTRITIVNTDCKTVYETLVKPLNPIIDYNTKFSGITKDQMEKTATNILQVQANILHLCSSKTILIGHSLESDMKALKIIHNNIVDTSVLFPHKFGLPHKRALRALASEYLNKIIQNSIKGHDSAEDALTCMELVFWKLKEELKVRGIKC